MASTNSIINTYLKRYTFLHYHTHKMGSKTQLLHLIFTLVRKKVQAHAILIMFPLLLICRQSLGVHNAV